MSAITNKEDIAQLKQDIAQTKVDLIKWVVGLFKKVATNLATILATLFYFILYSFSLYNILIYSKL